MVTVVTHANAGAHARNLDMMFRDRKTIFVDGLKWPLKVTEGVYEIDDFDTPEAVYLIDKTPTQLHRGSMRLVPTTRPHLMTKTFASLCEDGPPIGDDIWEMTRLCTAPSLLGEAGAPVRNRLARAMLEFGLLFGITTFVGTTHMRFMSRILAMGWECEPLGLPKIIDGEEVGAIRILNSRRSLDTMRRITGRAFPEIELYDAAPAA